jgi:ABC-type polysaccharide/polyol phosphate export permease
MNKVGLENDAATGWREYRPDSRLRDSAWTALKHLAAEFLHYRSNIATMFAQEFRNNYRGTYLGLVWNFALPLLPISVYATLTVFRVVPAFEGIHGGLAIALNVTCWFLFAACVSTPISVVQRRNAEAMKTSLPLSTVIAANFGRVLFETLVRLTVVMATAVMMHVVPAATAPLALPVLLVGMLLFVSVGHILAILNVVVPDFERVVNVGLLYGIFLSGVVFPLTAYGPLAVLQVINPFSVFITAARELLFLGHVGSPIALFVWSAIGLVCTLVAARLFYAMEQRIRGVV